MQIVSAEALGRALAALPENPRIVVSGNAGVPREAIPIIDRALERYTIHALNASAGVAPEREGVTAETCFVGVGMRKHPNLAYVPARLSLVPRLFRGPLPPDAVVVHCAPPRDGELSMGIECNILPAAIEACRARSGRIIAVINDQMPYLYGDAQLPLDHVDLAIELSSPLPEILPAPVDDDSSTIGQLVAARVPNGATMQTGIGAIPDATLGQLTRHTGLRVWTETFSDGVLALDRGGALDQSHPLTASFLIGSRELYDWADGNPRVRMMRTERTNDPALIALQRSMTSINTALEMDLFGQANASRINARIYSGFGGDELPAERRRHRARRRGTLGIQPAASGPAHHSGCVPPAGARRTLGRGCRARPRLTSRSLLPGSAARIGCPDRRQRRHGCPDRLPARGERGTHTASTAPPHGVRAAPARRQRRHRAA